jgi:hypothetical protein
MPEGEARLMEVKVYVSGSGNWQALKMADAALDGNEVWLLICPICSATVPTGYSARHLEWHVAHSEMDLRPA